MSKLIGVSNFVKRQTKNSRFSYYDGSWGGLVDLVKDNFNKKKDGYRDGVVLVPLPVDNFYTSICKITEDSKFETKFEARREGEEPIRRTVLLNGKKEPAEYVDVVLYRSDVLEENDERTTDTDWEIISINASLFENTPMHPMAMARNMLNKDGGTKGDYTGQQFAEALWFWKDYCMYGGE